MKCINCDSETIDNIITVNGDENTIYICNECKPESVDLFTLIINKIKEILL